MNHLAWAECGLHGGRSRSWERGHGGRVDGGLGLGVATLRPLLDCCSPDAFTVMAWPIQPADLIPSSPPLQAPLCLPRRLGFSCIHCLGRKSRQDIGALSPEPCQVRQTWGNSYVP